MSSKPRVPLWKILLGIFLTLLALAIFVPAVSYFALIWYPWPGYQEWAQTQVDLHARGEKLILPEFAPPPIPDSQNFFADPLWMQLADQILTSRSGSPSTEPRIPEGQRLIDPPPLTPEEIAKVDRQFPDFKWVAGDSSRYGLIPKLDPKMFSPALSHVEREQVAVFLLSILVPCQPILDRLRELAKRPDAEFPLHYRAGLSMHLPHITYLLKWGQMISAHAKASLWTGNPTAAFDDIELILRLADTGKREPEGISFLVRINLFEMAIDDLGKGLDTHAWNDEQLTDLQRRLEGFHFLADFPAILRGERASFNETMNTATSGLLKSVTRKASRNAIIAFVQGDQAFYSRFMQQWIDDMETGSLDLPEQNRRRFAAFAAFQTNFIQKYIHFYSLLSLPVDLNLTAKVVFTEDQVFQARLACALERYWLKHGSYPSGLSDLVPDFLASMPTDPLTHQPMKYRLLAPDKFLLWSVGWNLKDDGGVYSQVQDEGDWVWNQPPYPPQHHPTAR